MSVENLLNQFLGSVNQAPAAQENSGQGFGETLSSLSSGIPGGLAGGAAAGGIMALLVGNKSARKFATKAAGYGGAALLGGLAYRAYQQWQNNDAQRDSPPGSTDQAASPQQAFMTPPDHFEPAFELTLIKAMIAAAKSDGHIDSEEQQRVFQAVEKMDLSGELKGRVFDYLRQPISAEQLAGEATTIEQKSELYLASCMAIDLDHPSERAHLDALASALLLPRGLAQQLEAQVREALTEQG
jgi:uncharacterized membrane protein YebE (DUF533 family)